MAAGRGGDIHLGPGQDAYVEPRTVDVHIRCLRKAINASDETDLIRTVRSAGYSLDREA